MKYEPTHRHKTTGTLLSLKLRRATVSTFYVVDKDRTIQYMTGLFRRFKKICVTRNDNVEPYRTGRYQPNLFNIN